MTGLSERLNRYGYVLVRLLVLLNKKMDEIRRAGAFQHGFIHGCDNFHADIKIQPWILFIDPGFAHFR